MTDFISHHARTSDENIATFEPSEFTPKYYSINPKTEELLYTGHEVKPGMKIMMGDTSTRRHISDALDGGNIDGALLYNRWFEVLKVSTRWVPAGEYLDVLALFSDGTQRKISVESFLPWFVKKDSIPQENIRVVTTHRKLSRMANYGWFLIGMSSAVITSAVGIGYLWWQITIDLVPSCM